MARQSPTANLTNVKFWENVGFGHEVPAINYQQKIMKRGVTKSNLAFHQGSISVFLVIVSQLCSMEPLIVICYLRPSEGAGRWVRE